MTTRAGRARSEEVLAHSHPGSAVVGIAVGVLLAWAATYLAGGSHTVLPHLFYVPVLFAAVRFGVRGAVVTGLAAGVLAGPLLPADTSTGEAQEVLAWSLRTAMFVGVGSFVGWLTRHSSQSFAGWVNDHRSAVEIRAALSRGEMVVHYQPILALDDGEILGFEALVRWQHPSDGIIPPLRFIPAAERSGAIADIDRFVLHTATRDLESWGDDSLWVAVNVSAARFAEPGLVDDVCDAVASAGLRPDQLHLEITETAIIRDVSVAAEQIAALRGLGLRVAVDDFGAGQTSLSYLHQFGVDVIKIDRSFVVQTVTNPQAARLVSGVIRLFSAIGTEVVGEGISNAEEYVQMQSLGCEIGQGFYLGMPLPASEIPRMVERSQRRRARRGHD